VPSFIEWYQINQLYLQYLLGSPLLGILDFGFIGYISTFGFKGNQDTLGARIFAKKSKNQRI
jgi:hypothetical protein